MHAFLMEIAKGLISQSSTVRQHPSPKDCWVQVNIFRICCANVFACFGRLLNCIVVVSVPFEKENLHTEKNMIMFDSPCGAHLLFHSPNTNCLYQVYESFLFLLSGFYTFLVRLLMFWPSIILPFIRYFIGMFISQIGFELGFLPHNFPSVVL